MAARANATRPACHRASIDVTRGWLPMCLAGAASGGRAAARAVPLVYDED
jgi:hypothetical protein